MNSTGSDVLQKAAVPDVGGISSSYQPAPVEVDGVRKREGSAVFQVNEGRVVRRVLALVWAGGCPGAGGSELSCAQLCLHSVHKHRRWEESDDYTWYMSQNVLGEERLNLSVMSAVIGMSKFIAFYTCSLLVCQKHESSPDNL